MGTHCANKCAISNSNQKKLELILRYDARKILFNHTQKQAHKNKPTHSSRNTTFSLCSPIDTFIFRSVPPRLSPTIVNHTTSI